MALELTPNPSIERTRGDSTGQTLLIRRRGLLVGTFDRLLRREAPARKVIAH